LASSKIQHLLTSIDTDCDPDPNHEARCLILILFSDGSVANLDPSDPYVFGLPGSGSISQEIQIRILLS
jgi:hypothetical protein